MVDYSEKFLQQTISVWQKYFPHPLTLDDARTIADNMVSLIKLLSEMEEKYEAKP